MEGSENRITLSRREQYRILMHLTNAAVFEEFIQKRFLGRQKLFAEGAETLIPLLEMAIERAGETADRRKSCWRWPIAAG